MNIAVISSPETASGKSSFVSLLASVFAHTQQKRVAVLTTGDATDILSINDVKETASLVKSANIYRAQILSSAIRDEEIWDYGFRIGEDEVFLFDIIPKTVSVEEQKETFDKSLARIKAPMTLIELQGDPFSELNRYLIEKCDVVLYVFNHSAKEYCNIKAFKAKLGGRLLVKVGFVCQRFDCNVTSEKAVAVEIGTDVKNLMQIPYNAVIAKRCLSSNLDTVAGYIASGHNEVVSIRPKILEIMQYLYDNGAKKYIKGVDKWAR